MPSPVNVAELPHDSLAMLVEWKKWEFDARLRERELENAMEQKRLESNERHEAACGESMEGQQILRIQQETLRMHRSEAPEQWFP